MADGSLHVNTCCPHQEATRKAFCEAGRPEVDAVFQGLNRAKESNDAKAESDASFGLLGLYIFNFHPIVMEEARNLDEALVELGYQDPQLKDDVWRCIAHELSVSIPSGELDRPLSLETKATILRAAKGRQLFVNAQRKLAVGTVPETSKETKKSDLNKTTKKKLGCLPK
jgi:hypothetical protein